METAPKRLNDPGKKRTASLPYKIRPNETYDPNFEESQNEEDTTPRVHASKSVDYSIDPKVLGRYSLTSRPTMSVIPVKTANKYFRWNLIFLALIWLVIPFPIWLAFAWPAGAGYAILITKAVFTTMWVVVILLASKNMLVLFRNKSKDFRKLLDPDSEAGLIRHAFAMCAYKEPLDVICKSLDSIKNQTEVNSIICVICFEEKTPDVWRKSWALREKYKNCFENLLTIVHPTGVVDEIPGKCSNFNYGVRQLKIFLKIKMGEKFFPENILITTCDADSYFPPIYCSSLIYKYLSFPESQRKGTLFQAPLFYNWGLDSSSTVTRVTGLLRSTLMMGALIPFNINTMSIFSYSLELCMQGNYIHPRYQMDDIICLVRWMGVTQRRMRICLLPVAVISGPTSGRTVEDEWVEWARQARRWTIGAGEVFHYYVIKAPGMPWGAALSWGLSFLTYYGIFLCTDGLYSVSTLVSLLFIVPPQPNPVNYIFQAMAISQGLCFVAIFVLDALATKLLEVQEKISLVRNIFHLVMSPLVLLGYSLVELFAIHELAIKGKDVCKHGASKKGALDNNL